MLFLTKALCLYLCFDSVGFSQTNHLVTAPQTTQFLEIGSNFKATCMIIDTTEVTADDLYWKLAETTVSKELYTKLNESAISVTIPVTSVQSQWLYCRAKKEKSSYVFLNAGKFMYGVFLKKGCKLLLLAPKTKAVF